jgi:hypothetical protein
MQQAFVFVGVVWMSRRRSDEELLLLLLRLVET